MKKISISISLILLSIYSFGQCQLSCGINGTTNHTIEICLGDSLTLNATGGCSILMFNDFNTGTIGAGWSANCSPMFTNPCNAVGGTADGTIYCWIGPASNFPRELATVGYNLNCPGSNVNIQFDMKYSQQGDASPCEGPDLTTEGVHLQYWEYGASAWTEIQYWDPQGGYVPSLISWQHYNVSVPAAANSILTSFRWFQTNTSGNDYDHWGIDNVAISFDPPPTNGFTWWEGSTQLTPNQDYTFTPTTVGIHIYKVRVENTCGLFLEDSVMVTVNPIPTSTFTATSPICSDGVCTINYTGTGTGNSNYDWNFDNANILSGSSQGPITCNWATSTQHLITLQVSENGCFGAVDSALVDVFPAPTIGFSAVPTSGCGPLSVHFTDNTTGAVIQNWTWWYGDGSAVGTTSSPTHVYAPGNYDVTLKVITANGCHDSLTQPLLIHSYAPNNTDFTADNWAVNLSSARINFTDQSSNAATWYWTFGDGTNSSVQNPTHDYALAGDYNVCLRSATLNSCVDSICHFVHIVDDSLYFPNVFTPNGDGVNDVLDFGKIQNYLTSNLKVYNRWGKKVYDKDQYDNSFNGKGLADGVYYYVLTFEGYLKKGEHSGSVTIIR
ncbi:MAG: PKD domain-containing protein [Bacteroidota bacterium]